MTKLWSFNILESNGGTVVFTTADTASSGTTYNITGVSGSINGKTFTGLVTASTSLYDRTVQNQIRDSNPYSIGLIDSNGEKYFFTLLPNSPVYLLAPSTNISTWYQFASHTLTVSSGSTTPTPAPVGATEGADALTGTSGNDTINALGGNDRIDGRAGNDTINAGTGDDNITLSAGVDTIDGGEGSDTLTLSKDIASYTITYNAATQTFSIKDGSETSTFKNIEKIVANSISYNLVKAVSNSASTLTGTTGIDYLYGGSGADSLTGGAGADRMVGGLGDDTYFVDNNADQLVEDLNSGRDTVSSSMTYTLAANFEDLKLTGTGNINATGNDLDNFIVGNDGNNTIDGKGGYNQLYGGKGNDVFLVGLGTNDIDGGEGTDLLRFSGTATLSDWQIWLEWDGALKFVCDTSLGVTDVWTGSSIEQVTIRTGTSSSLTYALKIGKPQETSLLTGTAKPDMLVAGSGSDSLNGLAGADVMIGGSGDDVYTVDNAGDILREFEGGGVDTVSSSITYTLGSYLDNLTLTGSSAINATGNALANILVGNASKNTLSGGDGDDTLNGAVGQDTLTGGAGKDTFKFSASTESATRTPDTITDFVSDTDKVDVSGIDANTSTTGNQAFTFIGSAAFSRVAGQLRFTSNVLYGDTNGDGTADFQINMTGLSTLLATDIVL